MQWMCSEATAAGEDSIWMMLQNSSSVPVVRILQKHSQTTVLPDCELNCAVIKHSTQGAPGCASVQPGALQK